MMDRYSDDQSGSHENHDSEEESSVASSDLDFADIFERDLLRVRNNDPLVKRLCGYGSYDIFQNMTAEEWEDVGRDISNNTHLEGLLFHEEALYDEELESLFRGLTRSSSIVKLDLETNEFSAAGLRSLEPFLHNSVNLRELEISYNNIETEGFDFLMQALRDKPIERLDFSHCNITSIEIESAPNNLRELSLSGNNILSEGFNRLFRSLRDSSVEYLNCRSCGIESIDIDTDSFPKKLKMLFISSNRINSNGCHEIATLLQKTNTLQTLYLDYNLIDDEGVAIVVDALKTNTTLKYLDLEENSGISKIGRLLILKMLNDISSIKSTLQSNHTLQNIDLGGLHCAFISEAMDINELYLKCPEAAGREKVIQTQLHSKRRAELVAMQGVQSQSIYGEIKPLHLPEVLSLVSREHGQEELYVSLKASIAELLSTVNRRLCLQQRRAHYLAMVEDIDAELAALDVVEGDRDDSNETRGIKRLRA